jgi:hypothetical protein
MLDQSTLRTRALAAIREGRLSCVKPQRLWGGTGDGSKCSVCDSPIRPDEIGFELQCGDAGDGAACNVHSHCLAAWDFVRQHVIAAARDDAGPGNTAAAQATNNGHTTSEKSDKNCC